MDLSNLKKTALFAFLLFFAAAFDFAILNAESFRVKKTVFINLADTGLAESNAETDGASSETVFAGINDCICINLPSDLTFIQGIELNIKIPPAITRCPNTIIYSLYDNISPVPSAKTIDYTGQELYTGVYPGLFSLTIQIPLVKGNSIKKTPYADKTLIPEHSRNFVFLRNQLAMKGIPAEVYSAQFEVSARPILINKGRLIIKTNSAQLKNMTVTVDDKPVELDKNNSCFLKPGLHNITITADSVRNENRSCMIEVAKDTVLEVNLKSTAPSLSINMPQGTQVFVNSQITEIKNKTLSLAPGEYTLKFILGGYEVVKQITVQEGRSYSITVTLDADILEN
ncbi:MAG: PEGA domain-containing protein [Treponema sp.]